MFPKNDFIGVVFLHTTMLPEPVYASYYLFYLFLDYLMLTTNANMYLNI